MRPAPNQALDQSRDLVWQNGDVDSSRPGQRGRSPVESLYHAALTSVIFRYRRSIDRIRWMRWRDGTEFDVE